MPHAQPASCLPRLSAFIVHQILRGRAWPHQLWSASKPATLTGGTPPGLAHTHALCRSTAARLTRVSAAQIPEKGKIYAFNEGNYMGWTPELREYIDSLKQPEKWDGKAYSSRCDCGLSCPADLHPVICMQVCMYESARIGGTCLTTLGCRSGPREPDSTTCRACTTSAVPVHARGS